MRAEQRLREQLAAANGGVIGWQHEGKDVVRTLTGGSAPTVKAVFQHQSNETAACCPHCKAEFGRFDASYGSETGSQIEAIRHAGAGHEC